MTAQELAPLISLIENEKSIFIKLVEAYQKMDHRSINDLLDDNTYYDDMNKIGFIHQQKLIFEEFKSKKDTHLILSTNICSGCLCNQPVVVFTGNNSGHRYAVYIEFTQTAITDIYRCMEQSDDFDCIVPF